MKYNYGGGWSNFAGRRVARNRARFATAAAICSFDRFYFYNRNGRVKQLLETFADITRSTDTISFYIYIYIYIYRMAINEIRNGKSYPNMFSYFPRIHSFVYLIEESIEELSLSNIKNPEIKFLFARNYANTIPDVKGKKGNKGGELSFVGGIEKGYSRGLGIFHPFFRVNLAQVDPLSPILFPWTSVSGGGG